MLLRLKTFTRILVAGLTLAFSISSAEATSIKNFQPCEDFLKIFQTRLPRLTYRPLFVEDLEEYYAISNDPRFTEFEPATTKAESLHFLRGLTYTYFDMELASIGLTHSKTKQLIGFVDIFDEQDSPHSVQIGYGLSPEHWGQGYMSEALPPLIAFLCSQMSVKVVRAEVREGNKSSSRLLERLGFEYLGFYESSLGVAGKPMDHFEYHCPKQLDGI